jgi:hypothetical protein
MAHLHLDVVTDNAHRGTRLAAIDARHGHPMFSLI